MSVNHGIICKIIILCIYAIQLNAIYYNENFTLAKMQWNPDIHYEGISLDHNNFDDIELFSHKNVNYVSLMMSCLKESLSTTLVQSYLLLFEMNEENNTWTLKFNITVPKKNSLKTITVDDGTLIILIDNTSRLRNNKLDEYILVYHLDDNQSLRIMQTLISGPLLGFNTWTNGKEVFLTLLSHTENNGLIHSIYIWKGSHFDVIQVLTSGTGRKLVISQFESTVFLGLAVQKRLHDEFKMDIEIYTFSEHDEIFIFSHKLRTGKVLDLFFIVTGFGKDSAFFLIAETKYVSKDVSTSKTSIIYKLNKHFVPSQHLKFNNSLKIWIVLKDYDTMVLAIDHEGLIVLKDNGWKFTVIHSDKFFVPSSLAVNHVKVFEIFSKTIIGFITDNIHKPVLFYEISFQRFQNPDNFISIFNEWVELMFNMVSSSLDKNAIKEKIMKFEFLSQHKLKCIQSVSKMDKVTIENAIVQEFSDDYMHRSGYINANLLTVINTAQQMGYLLKFINLSYENVLNDEDILKTKKLHVNNVQIISEDVPEFKNLFVNKFWQRYSKNPFEVGYKTLENSIIPVMRLKSLTFKSINNFTLENMKHKIGKQMKENGLKVDGNLYIHNNIILNGNINTVNFTEHSLLLKNGQQEIHGNIVLPNANAEKLETFNNHNTYNTAKPIKDNEQTDSVQKVYDKIIVKSMNISGLLGRAKVDKIIRSILTLNSNHVIKGKYNIHQLEGNKVEYLSTSKKDEFINIASEDQYVLNQDVILFDGEITALNVKERLNNIFVDCDKLLVLEKTSPDPVSMSKKSFDTLKLLKPINLFGGIKSSNLKPTVVVKTPTTLYGKYRIIGNLTVGKQMIFKKLLPSLK